MNDLPKPDIRALASLSRIEVSESEIPQLEQELSGILAFVEEVAQAGAAAPAASAAGLHNVMRDDIDPHEPGAYTDALLAAAPAHADGYVEVQQVLSHTKKNRS